MTMDNEPTIESLSPSDIASPRSTRIGNAARAFSRFASSPEDTASVRSEKLAILLVASSCSLAGLVWFGVYMIIFGWTLPTSLPLVFTLVVGSSLLIAHQLKSHQIAVYAQIVSIIGITFLIQWTVGGLFDSGLVMLWAFIGPLVALSFLSVRQAVVWYGIFVFGVVTTIALEPNLAMDSLQASDATHRLLFALNLGFMSLIVFAFTGYYVRATVAGRATADKLLLNVLPKKIAEDLKEHGMTPAQRFDSVSVVFADIVGSTSVFAGMNPGDVLEWLNDVFGALDNCVERHGLEKLHTAGDGYMAASGVPEPRTDHASAAVRCCLDMASEVSKLPPRYGNKLEFRFGVNSGPVVAGVIGSQKFRYDIWGDTVNVASRMESTAEPGAVHISDLTYGMIADEYLCRPRGPIEVKGKGQMKTWYVVGAR
jgi:guanylate cyclase